MVYFDDYTHTPASSFSILDLVGGFECDDLIAPTIQVLLNKGYKTEFCCQGHYYNYIWVNDEANEFDDYLYMLEKHNIKLVKDVYYDTPYIIFKKPYIPNFKNLPKGWEVDSLETVCGIYYDLFSEIEKEDLFKFNEKILNVMKDLYTWSLSLPKYE